MQPIELEIFYLTDSQTETVSQNEKLGLPTPEYNDFEEYETRKLTFCNINVFAPYKYKGELKYTKIYTNGEHWIANITYEELKEKLQTLYCTK